MEHKITERASEVPNKRGEEMDNGEMSSKKCKTKGKAQNKRILQ